MRILLVDDDTTVLRTLLAVLRKMPGHEVRASTSGDEALETAAALGGLDILITDVVMEPVDGFALRDRLAAQYPGARTIFISGFDLSEYQERIGAAQFLEKPVTVETLTAAVERELSAPRPAAATVPRPATVLGPSAVAAAAQPAPGPRVAAGAPKAITVQPRAAAPKAMAVPKAQPVATAVPKSAAAPKATGAPQAAPIPRATPKAVAGAPQARPIAQSAAPTARAVSAAPAAQQPRATARPAAPASAQPQAPVARAAVAVARPVASAAPPAPTPVETAPEAEPEPEPEPTATQIAEMEAEVEEQAPADYGWTAGLIGQIVGGYQIVSHLADGRWGTLFAAVQTSINRPVGLKVLDPVRARDAGPRDRFIADARAKAHVQHPSILSVYEAGAADGWIFYTHEYVDGQSLEEMYGAGRVINETVALKVLRVAAEGLLYLSRNEIPHTALQASDIYLGVDAHPRLSNLATQFADQQLSVEGEIQVLGEALWPVLAQPVSGGMQALMARTQQASENAITTWGALLQGIKALEPKVIPVGAEKISAQERAAAAAAEKARKAQRRGFYLNVGSMVTLVALAGWAIWNFALKSNERTLDDQIHIPAGDFITGEGTTATGPEFWIDKYETTIGQYEKFVEWIHANPGEEHTYDHARQPKQNSHVPEHWDIYYLQAKAGGAAHSAPITLNSPVMTVTWWDAYAYAKWKGRELPTVLEWERASRGVDGRAYPWGDDPDPKKANTNADFIPDKPGAKGTVDGFNYWGDVDAQKYDKSPDGVIGMAGNVSEWTSTWTADNTKPILKGGNFSVPLMKLSESVPEVPGASTEFIGFRTISHKPPEK